MFQAPLFVDPWQALLLLERLRGKGVDAREFPFTGGGRQKVFGTLLDVIRRRCLRSHPHPVLKQELLSLEVKESLSGYRVDHKSGGHDDATVAIGLALQGLPLGERGEYFPEAVGSRDTAGLVRGAGWTTANPSPSHEQGPSVWRGGPSGGKINWDNLKW